MEMDFTKLERTVGAFIIGVSVLLLATLVLIGRGKDWFESYDIYYTNFNETYNLQENAAVKLFKADIGKVLKISLETNRVRVKLAILKRYASRIRRDSIAVVESPTLIGSEYISILPGANEAPLIPPDGDIRSREKRSLPDILAEYEIEKTAKMAVKAIQSISSLTETLSSTGSPLWKTLQNLEQISDRLNALTMEMAGSKGPELLQAMEVDMHQIHSILQNLDAAVGQAPATMELVRKNLNSYLQTGESVKAGIVQVRDIVEKINYCADSLQVILENVKKGSYKVPKITDTFQEGIQEIRQGMEEIDRVVESLQQNFLIRSNLPPEPTPTRTVIDARPQG